MNNHLPSFMLISALFVLDAGHTATAQDLEEEIYNWEENRKTLFGKTLAHEPYEELNRRTRLSYDNFDVVIHDFNAFMDYRVSFCEDCEKQYYPNAYETEEENAQNAEGMFDEIILGYNETDQNTITDQTLIVFKDTLNVYESFGNENETDSRINNTLFQILPKNGKDKFQLSICYQTTLYEVLDDRHILEDRWEAWEVFELIREKYNEQTEYIALEQTYKNFFLAMPHQADMMRAEIIDGEIVFQDLNDEKQLKQEQKIYDDELRRIKNKYELVDTLIHIPGEYDTYITLAKGKQLFSYSYDRFLIKIERLEGDIKKETKFISVEILYGC